MLDRLKSRSREWLDCECPGGQKHTDAFLDELVVSTEGKTEARLWYTDNWGGYERVLPPEVTHVVGKENTQRL
ncbi:MAG: hypothetical protein AAF773_09085, partial [Cyanobacteria bacterium P01_D01_bin.115]